MARSLNDKKFNDKDPAVLTKKRKINSQSKN